ncbi:hypothetical protein FNV43_RR10544 [Rhamnella rubrinervis]|uniref:AAA+ ATPase domain-containing protein n=1 Tax=Rhamnella rubrinervis TaxID=2594499 RepID=A0A8K0H4A7_9ROSA|nr:hypothetical protein FNV43_RR10544 [Rhamnella rubrinervis]
MDIIQSIAFKISDMLVEPVVKQIGYLIFYEDNIKDLADETAKLKDKRAGIQLSMEEATGKSEVIAPEVVRWVTEVDKITNEFERFLKEDAKANKMYFLNGLLPNLKLRRSLGRKAKKKTEVVLQLLEEAKFDTISYPPPPTGMHFSPSMKAFDSRTRILNQVMEALRDGNMHTIAICGIGGIGKTTMAKEVARRAKEEKLFKEVAMAVVSQKPNVTRIQGEIADLLGLSLTGETTVGRAGELYNRIKSIAKILIILDDIWERLDLEAVGIPTGEEHPGCTILLTSRDVHVARNQMRCQMIFNIQALSDNEAWDLFEEVVGNSINTPDLNLIAKQIASECSGLPAAIVTVGRALQNRSKEEWNDVLRQLRKSKGTDANVYSSIELS